MAGIEPPGDVKLPPGPKRDLVLALHGLYRSAGRPGLRKIANAITEDDALPDTVSHETVSAMLRGTSIPRWPKLECIVRQLSIWHHPRLDPDAEVSRFLTLWNAANSPSSHAPDTAGAGSLDVDQNLRQPPVARLAQEQVDTVNPGERHLRVPEIWGEIPYRNKNFTGRSGLLQQLDLLLHTVPGSGGAVALHGLLGTGKTQVAMEYAHRHRSEYNVVWWIHTEQLPSVRSALASLAQRLGLESAASTGADGSAAAALDALRRGQPYDRCLLIFDGADQPEEIVRYLPDGPAHALITSRNPRWQGVMDVVTVDTFSRAESVEFLTRGADLAVSGREADSLAEAVGDLPLALAQALMLIANKGMSPAQCTRLITERPAVILAQDNPHGYPHSTTAVLRLATAKLGEQLPEALTLLRCLAFLGLDPIPLSILRQETDQPPAQLSEVQQILADPILSSRTINEASRFGLVRTNRSIDALHIHRLTKEMLRDELSPAEQDRNRSDSQVLLDNWMPPG
jgi:hypothetical protein